MMMKYSFLHRDVEDRLPSGQLICESLPVRPSIDAACCHSSTATYVQDVNILFLKILHCTLTLLKERNGLERNVVKIGE